MFIPITSFNSINVLCHFPDNTQSIQYQQYSKNEQDISSEKILDE